MTPTTKSLLEECEAARRALHWSPKGARSPAVVEGYLADLRETLSTDTGRARDLIGKLVGPILLRLNGDRFVREVRGNLPALLDLEVTNNGAGSPSLTLATLPPADRIVA